MANTMVGLARNIKLKWLNKIVEFLETTQNISELKLMLDEYLSFEITSKDNIRKTRDILLNIWVRDDDDNKSMKDKAFELIHKYPEDAAAIHWSLILLRYPIFVDTCDVIGRLSEYQDEITTAQIQKRLYDKWGERNTLLHSTAKVLQTIKDMEALNGNGKGIYTVNHYSVKQPEVVDFILHVAMKIDGKSYYAVEELNDFRFLFPYHLEISRERLFNSKVFSMHNTGGELAISLK